MRTIVITKENAYKRIDKALRETFPRMPASALHKAFRKKDIKVNGQRVKEDHIIMPDDSVDIYITDDILDGIPKKISGEANKGFSVVYEDHNLMIVNKEQGIPVHPDKEQSTNTLIDLVQAYLIAKGEYTPGKANSFPPSLCHRLDRNTGGLIIIAKNSESLKILLDKIKDREIKKYYQCLVQGRVQQKNRELKAYLFKDEKKSHVFISENKTKHSLEIITRYKLLSYETLGKNHEDVSRLEVELVTGRTHQIRAHLAHIGHPIVGDGKYGTNTFNRSTGVKFQALWATKIVFDFKDKNLLSYLNGQKFQVEPQYKNL